MTDELTPEEEQMIDASAPDYGPESEGYEGVDGNGHPLYRSEDIGTEGLPPNWAVVDNRGDDLPDVYTFVSFNEAQKFLNWLRRDTRGAYDEEVFITLLTPIPAEYRG